MPRGKSVLVYNEPVTRTITHAGVAVMKWHHHEVVRHIDGVGDVSYFY